MIAVTDGRRRGLAAEVLEMGETLFDAVLDVAATGKSESLPEVELRTAADEFFQALRALMRLPESGAPDEPVP